MALQRAANNSVFKKFKFSWGGRVKRVEQAFTTRGRRLLLKGSMFLVAGFEVLGFYTDNSSIIDARSCAASIFQSPAPQQQ